MKGLRPLKDPIRKLLLDYRTGRCKLRDVVARLEDLPYKDLRFAKVDLHRLLRRGLPEVIYAHGKSVPQVVSIAKTMQDNDHPVLITKVKPSMARELARQIPSLRYYPEANMMAGPNPCGAHRSKKRGSVLVVTAGTSDIPVAEEAAVTLQWIGQPIRRLYDIGVAGFHRLLDQRPLLRRARAIVAVAGMDGALPSVLSGLVAVPVVAVPTSVGYGASFKGVAPLLTMLNSCSPGVAVVNIDNGFGAGVLAAMIASR